MKDKKVTQGKLFSISFRHKIAAVFTLLITFIMLMSVYLVTFQVKRSSLKRAEQSGRLLGRIIALTMGEDIVRGNFQSIKYALKKFSKLQRIDYCLIIDNFGKVISSTEDQLSGKYFSDAWSRSALNSSELSIRRAMHNNRPLYDTSVPIIIGGKRHALIRVGFTLQEEYENIRSLLFYNLSLGIMLILVGIFTAYAVSSTLLSPLNAILGSLESMSKGDFSQKAFVNTSDEFEQLALSFNRLSNFLQDKQNADKFIGNKIWEADKGLQQKHFSGKNIEAVVLHLQLSHFSHFIERHSASESVDTLNSFYKQMSKIIADSGGIVDRIGDGSITSIFPVVKGDRWPASLRAGFTAFMARSEIYDFNFKQAQLGLEDLALKSGISAGTVIVGKIGAGSQNDFSVLGAPVMAAKKAAEISGRKNDYRPVATLELVKKSSDFLSFNQLRIQSSYSEEIVYYSIETFSNLSFFKEKLDDVSEHAYKSIVWAFGLSETNDGLEFLKSIIADKENKWRLEAVKALAPYLRAKNQDARDILINLIKEESDEQFVALAITLLGRVRDSFLVDVFIDLFKHENSRVRADAVEACIPLKFSPKQELLKEMLQDSAPRVCANALLGLWLADDKETLACLYALLKADDSKMRASGAFAVYFLASSRRFRRLFPAYSETEAFSVLPIIENILNRLKAMLESPEASERFQALRAAGKVGYNDFRQNIIELLKDEDEPQIVSLASSILKEWEFHVSPDEV